MQKESWGFLGIAALSLLVMAFVVTSRGAAPQPLSHITVSGTATLQAQPDTAVVNLGIQTEGQTVADAQKANDATMSKIQAAMKALGLPATAIQTQGYNIQSTYNQNGSSITGYNVNDQITVTVKKISLTGQVISAATTAGANQVMGVNWEVSHPASLQATAYVDALKNARQAADKMAQSLGVQITGVASISTTQQPSVLPVQMYSASTAMADAPVQPGQQPVTVTLQVVFNYR